MKLIPAKISLLWTGILFSSLLTVAAVQTTYQVNMGVQIALGNFHPATDTVLVSGNFTTPNWQSTVSDGAVNQVLTPSVGDTNIYVGTFNNAIAPGGYDNHKFIINPNNNFSSLNWENVTGGGNRFFQVAGSSQTLPVVYFGDQSSVPSTLVPVTFRVDMGVQITLGHFDPNAGDYMVAAGDFNPVGGSSAWATDFILTNVPNTTVYAGVWGVTNLSPGATVNHKFIMNTSAGQGWENNGVGPNGANNRQFVLPSSATNLPAVFFNNVTNASSLVTTQVTFQVNLAVPIAQGVFDPSGGTVSVAGDVINNWSPFLSQLTQSGADSNNWVGTFTITNAVGGPVNYKFVLNNGGTWESVPDRQFIFPNTATNLAGVFFNNIGDLGQITNTISGGDLTLSWRPGPLIWVQASTSLSGAWNDLPDTTGQSSLTTNVTAKQLFFRLKGP